jgi:dienelactone hydrolase
VRWSCRSYQPPSHSNPAPRYAGAILCSLLFASLCFSGQQTVPSTEFVAPVPIVEPPTSLAGLIQAYLETNNSDRADSLLTEILQQPQASVTIVQSILERGPIYQLQVTGRQPSVQLPLRDRIFRYGLYVPVSYRPTRDYPLVLCLHGAGFTGETYLDRWESRLGEDYILACPTLLEGTWWTRTAEDLILATIQSVQARYRVDPDRVFLTGMSNGGIGTYLVGMHHASLFAGLAPMASGLDEVLYPFLENLRHTPLYVIHGARDEVMPVELSHAVTKELTRLGIPFVYREHERVHPMAGGHFFPREELPQLVEWFGSTRRDPLPKTVTVVRDTSHLSTFAWVRIDATEPIATLTERLTDTFDQAIVNGVFARLQAEIVAPNRIEVRTQRVKRYTLFLNEKLVNLANPITIVTNSHVSHVGTVNASVETLLRDARLRRDRQRLFPSMLTIAVEAD